MPQPACDAVLERPRTDPLDFLDEHLNVQWLRPESALCDAIASHRISQAVAASPSLDLGCGNGLFSFITAGGKFSPSFDLYLPEKTGIRPEWILSRPPGTDWGLDLKIDSVTRARELGFYRQCAVADAQRPLPFPAESFQTIFSNMLYWLKSPSAAFSEVTRLLRAGGQALLSFPDPVFSKNCWSFQPKGAAKELLQRLNRDRSSSIRWTLSASECLALARKNRLKVKAHFTYYSPLTLRIWDIGLRPLAPVLTTLVQCLKESDRSRIKQEWIGTVRPLLTELLRLEEQDRSGDGFHFFCLEKER